MEESKRNLEDSQNNSFNSNENNNNDTSSSQNSDAVQPPSTPATPDYAAGLTALNPPTPSLIINNRSPIHAPSTPLQPPSTPYAQSVTSYFQSTSTPTKTSQAPLYTPVIMESNGKMTILLNSNIPKKKREMIYNVI